MKKAFITTAIIAAIMAMIIVVRMILSVTISEQVADVFCKVAVSALFFYFICRLSKNKLKTAK